MEYAVKALLIWLFCLLCVLLHELGHAVGYRIGGGKAAWRIYAGSGPEIFTGGKITFRVIPAGGYFLPEENPGTKKGTIAMLAGGPLASLLLTVLMGGLLFGCPGLRQPGSGPAEILLPVCSFLLYFNFFQFLFTVIPVRYRIVCRGLESDGLQIIHTLKQGKAR